jgi:hypothetical protein
VLFSFKNSHVVSRIGLEHCLTVVLCLTKDHINYILNFTAVNSYYLTLPEHYILIMTLFSLLILVDYLCGLVVRVPSYRSRDPLRLVALLGLQILEIEVLML